MKKFLVLIFSMCLVISLLPQAVFADTNVKLTDFSSSSPANWTLAGAVSADGVLEVPADSSVMPTWRLQKPYPSGTVSVEYDFKSNGQRAMVFIQNPNGGSAVRLQLNSTYTLNLQHSNTDGTANETTLLTNTIFETNTWYHMRHVISYKAAPEKTTSSFYMYDADGSLLLSAEDKVYMDASRFASPENLQVIILQNPGSSGSVYFDNFAVFEQTEESVMEANKTALAIPNADRVEDNLTLKTMGLGGAEISWQSSDESVITNDGAVNEVMEQTTVNLTATITYGGLIDTVVIPVTVVPKDKSRPEGVVYAFDFDNNILPSGVSKKTTEGFNGARNKRIELVKPENATVTVNPQLLFNFNQMAHGAFGQKLIVEFDYTSTSDKGCIAYFQATPNSGSVLRIEQTDAATMKFVTGGAGDIAVNTNLFDRGFVQGKEYHARVVLDYDNAKCWLYINGVAIAEDHHFMVAESPGVLNALYMLHTGTAGTIALDNLVLYHDGADESVIATGEMLKIEKLSAVTEDLVLPEAGYNGTEIVWTSSVPEIISNEGVLLAEPTVDTKVTLTAVISKAGKKLVKEFTANVVGVPEYTTVTFSAPVISAGENGKQNVTVHLTKPREQELPFHLITAVYDKNNFLVNIASGSKVIDANKVTGELSIEMPDIDVGNGTIKIFIWDSMESAKPLSNVTEIPFITDAEMTIACWGDSLTFGQGSTNDSTTGDHAYPAVLAELTGETVYNLGVGGETSMTIAARQGAEDIVFHESFTIPESGSVNLPLSFIEADGVKQYYLATANDGKVVPRDYRRGMWNPVTINGVEGTLTFEVNTDLNPRMLNSATFTRTEAGSSVPVRAGDKMLTAASKLRADVNIFFTGTNGGWNANNTKASDNAVEAADLVNLIKSQIAKTKDPSKFIVIGLTNGNGSKWNITNGALKEAFGDHFLDAKAYLATEQALKDAEITPTAQDLADLANGTIPTSFRVDSAHFNDAGYRLLANLVYEKLNELKYLWNSEICEVKDNKKAIWTFTSDDALITSCEYFSSEFNRLNLRGSFAMIVKKLLNSDGSVNAGIVNRFKTIFADDNFDITNHTYNHLSPHDDPDNVELWKHEINDAQSKLEELFPGERVFTVANPLVATYDTIDGIIKENNWAARNGKYESNTTLNYNSLNPTEDEWFHLKWQHGNEYCTVESMKKWVDTAIQNRRWQLELWHGVDGEGSSPVPSDIATPYFEYVASKKNELWIATFNEAVQYLREKQHATLNINANNSGNLEVSITHDLPQDIFNYPLSVRTRVPADWNTVSVTQGDRSYTVAVSSRHIVYDVIPDGSTAVIEKVN